MCERRSILYLHLLQPTLHLPGSKPLTETEIAGGDTGTEWIEGVQTGYPILRARGRQLQDAGVPFIDATMLFAEVNEELYYDACHFGVAGHERLADVVVDALLKALPD
jgi:lysophospholipase L1-like esterase